MDLGPTQILCDDLKIFNLEDLRRRKVFPHKVIVTGCRDEVMGMSLGTTIQPTAVLSKYPASPLQIHDWALYFVQGKCRTGSRPATREGRCQGRPIHPPRREGKKFIAHILERDREGVVRTGQGEEAIIR